MTKNEVTELEVSKDSRTVLHILDPDGVRSGACVELRYEANGRFRLFYHSEETCNPVCEPVIDMTYIRPEDLKPRQDGLSEGVFDFIDALVAVFGEDSVMTLDEDGIRPVRRPKNKHRH